MLLLKINLNLRKEFKFNLTTMRYGQMNFPDMVFEGVLDKGLSDTIL